MIANAVGLYYYLSDSFRTEASCYFTPERAASAPQHLSEHSGKTPVCLQFIANGALMMTASGLK